MALKEADWRMRERRREREFPLIEGRGARKSRKEEARRRRRMATGRRGGGKVGWLVVPYYVDWTGRTGLSTET